MARNRKKKKVPVWYILLTLLLAVAAAWLTVNFLGWGAVLQMMEPMAPR